jgi:hypothetical protein
VRWKREELCLFCFALALSFFSSPTLAAVKTTTGRSVDYEMAPADTVLMLKQKYQDSEGINVPQIRFLLGGKNLKDEDTLEAAGVVEGSVITMMPFLKGGRS